jgi:hypothetical protein
LAGSIPPKPNRAGKNAPIQVFNGLVKPALGILVIFFLGSGERVVEVLSPKTLFLKGLQK